MHHASIFYSFSMSYYTSTVWLSLNFVYKELSFAGWVYPRNKLKLGALDSNMNTELENFNSAEVNLHGFMPMSGDNFSDYHYRHDQRSHPLSFLSLLDGTDAIQNFNFFVDDQSGSVYDHMNHFPVIFGPQRDGMGTRVESFMNSDPPQFGPGLTEETKGRACKKRKKNDVGDEKPREVVHVRAKRGEATDSHSLAERMRREKINEKLRRLQDLVPGCYKTMGMSVMLDVIINYVRSLQNQIEFLSMKLSAASMFYDFNSPEMDAMETMKGTNGHEAQVMERMVEGYGEPPCFQSTWSL